MRRSLRRSVVLSSLAATVAFGLAACGDDEAGSGEAAQCVTVAPTAGVTELEVTGKNLAFDVECFEIQPGPVAFTFVNADNGVSHNLHVTGTGVNEATDLERGESTQVLEFELTQPGRYDFVCDPHGTMEGSITVVAPSAAAATSTTA